MILRLAIRRPACPLLGGSRFIHDPNYRTRKLGPYFQSAGTADNPANDAAELISATAAAVDLAASSGMAIRNWNGHPDPLPTNGLVVAAPDIIDTISAWFY